MSEEYKAHYISGTHWDREWYRTYQEFRLLFVKLVDELLDMMENNPEFKYFHFDGQTIVLDDYMEIRPENRERLAKLIKEGRILVGPWYTMPDLLCPGAESLVRNLLTGKRISTEWGVEAMPVAYTCDMFGHPSQMPQIYCGFNLPYCVLGRGTNESTTDAFFNWEAPDGSKVFTFKLQDWNGYGAFIQSRIILEQEESSKDRSKAAEALKNYIGHETSRTNGDTICLIDALDHMPPASDAAGYVKLIQDTVENVDVCHSTLPAFFKDAEKGARAMRTKRGELREPAQKRCSYLWLIPNCVSSRVKIKAANDLCQALLELQAEPLMAVALDKGLEPAPRRMLKIAWDTLLSNHAHDSICGCSIDQVHKDMLYRFDQVEQLSLQLRNRSMGDLTALCRDLAKEPEDFTVTISNTLPHRKRGPIIIDIDFPLDWSTRFHDAFRSQDLNAFILEDAEGQRLEYQILALQEEYGERTRYARVGWGAGGQGGKRYKVAVDTDVPAMGFTSILVRPAPMLVRPVGSLRCAPNAAENENLKVTVCSNGTLELLDKANGNVYRDLLTFEDCSEIGDGWFHGHCTTDEIALSTGNNAQISVIHDGPLCVTFRIQLTMNLPVNVDWHKMERSARREDLAIISTVTLLKGASSVQVESKVFNNIEDHRLKVLCPSGAEGAQTWFAHHPYDFVERPVAIDPATRDWSEMEQVEKPFLNVQAVGNGKQGLAFISGGGMHEGGIVDDQCRTIQTTLLRSYRRTVGTPGEKDGLELGESTFRFALKPYCGRLPGAQLLREMQELQAPVTTRQTGKNFSGYPKMQGELAPVQSFCEMLDGNLTFSTLKPAEDGKGQILRIWNPTDTEACERIRIWKDIDSCSCVKLDEVTPADDEATANGNIITVKAAPHRIVTVRWE